MRPLRSHLVDPAPRCGPSTARQAALTVLAGRGQTVDPGGGRHARERPAAWGR